MIDNKRLLIRRRQALVCAGAAGLALAAPTVSAQERVKTGTVEIEQVQMAFIGSGNLGSGTLQFQGKSYRFTVGGLGVPAAIKTLVMGSRQRGRLQSQGTERTFRRLRAGAATAPAAAHQEQRRDVARGSSTASRSI